MGLIRQRHSFVSIVFKWEKIYFLKNHNELICFQICYVSGASYNSFVFSEAKSLQTKKLKYKNMKKNPQKTQNQILQMCRRMFEMFTGV